MSKISDLVHGVNGYMDFVDYTQTYKDDNKEFLRGDMWQLDWVPPKIVYWPGDKIMNARLNTVNVAINYGVSGIQKRMRGNFSIYQQTSQDTSGTLTLGFIDKEDQAITYFIHDWKDKVCNMETRFSFRKDDIVADKLTLHVLNSSRIPVRTLEFYNCIIMDGTLDESGSDAPEADRADVQLSMMFETYSRTFENI